MRRLLRLVLVLGMVPITAGQITLEVYEADGETPFDCNEDIMVGTKLTIIVSSDSNDYWSGGLFITGQDRALGTLGGRDLDPNTRDWTGSHYEDAGEFAKVDGLRWKIWIMNEAENEAGGIYLFEDDSSMQAMLAGPLAGQVMNHPALSDISVKQFDIMPNETATCRGPV